MRRFFITTVALMLTLATFMKAGAEDKKYPVPRYAGFGIYGYKTGDNWRIYPIFDQAKPFNDGLAAVSFDGKKYALMNEYGAIVTDFIFTGAPEKFTDGMAVVNGPQAKYFINLKGEKISPDFRFVNRQGPLIIASPDNSRYNLYNYNFEPLNAEPYKSLTLSIITMDNQRAAAILAETADGETTMLDWTGKPLMEGRYTMAKQMWHYTKENKGLKKAFDKGFFNGGENILVAVKSAQNGQYGIASLAGNEVVACTYPTEKKLQDAMKKLVKDKLLPYLRRNAASDIATLGEAMNKSREELRKSNMASSKTELLNPGGLNPVLYFHSVVESRPKASGKKKAKGKTTYYLSMTDKPEGEAFSEITTHGIHFVCTRQGETVKRLYNIYGKEVGEPADEIDMWGYNGDDVPIFKFKKNNKWGLMSCAGNVIQQPKFDHINNMTGTDEVISATIDGKCYALNAQNGLQISNIPYDHISMVKSNDGFYSVNRLGYSTKIDNKGVEHPSVPELVFNEIERLPQDACDQRIEGYKKCIGLCGNNDRNVLGLCWNNMGVMFMKKGDTASGRACYEKGASYGNQTARSNLAGIKQEERQQTINAVGEFLNNLNQAFNGGAAGGTTTFGGNYSGSTQPVPSGSSGSSSGKSGDLGLSTYQSIYARWERNAKSNYDSLTRAGVRAKQNGKDVGGSSGGSWRPQNYTGLKQNLRNAQNEMRKIRQEARRYGHNIPQSNYETVTVSY